MRILNFASFLFFLLFFFCSEAPKIEFQRERIVVAELFTFARCPYCPYAYYALDSLRKEFKDSLIVIAYHRNLLGDTLSPSSVEKRREFYYESGGEPAVFFNGFGPIRTESPEDNYPTYKSEILKERSKKLKILPKIEEVNDSLKISFFVIDTFLNRDIRLLSLILEDSVYFKQSGARDSVYHCVFRGFIPDEEGIRLKNLNYFDSLIILLKMPNFNKKQYLVFFVQDFNTKEIFTGGIFKKEKR
uniref:Thioredoxin-like fold domain-containing protein n=1 Tax=candidate division WOR-3 bacterium TaxID=2052148 RepID=A0A7V4E3U9_UNCW3